MGLFGKKKKQTTSIVEPPIKFGPKNPLPEFDGNYPMTGCWLVASQPAGMCIREDRSPITSDDSRFIPHLILD